MEGLWVTLKIKHIIPADPLCGRRERRKVLLMTLRPGAQVTGRWVTEASESDRRLTGTIKGLGPQPRGTIKGLGLQHLQKQRCKTRGYH